MFLDKLIGKLERKFVNVCVSENDVLLLCELAGFAKDQLKKSTTYFISPPATMTTMKDFNNLAKQGLVKKQGENRCRITRRGIRYVERCFGVELWSVEKITKALKANIKKR